MSIPKSQLQANALGLLTAAALTAAYMAPATSIYALFGPMVSQVGVAVGFVMLVGLVMILPSAVSFGMLAKEMPAAGGAYAWATRALGPSVGMWVGLTTAAYYTLTVFFPPIVFGQFFNELLPLVGVVPNTWTWLLGAIVSLVITGSFTYRGIVVSSRLAFTMLMTELAVVVALSLTFLGVAIAEGRFSWDPVLPSAAKGGASGIILALPLALLSMTCDAATPASEETRDAKRTIPLAVVLPCILVGIWYVVGFAAFAIAAPPNELARLVADPNTNPVAPLARRVWQRFDVLVTLTGLTACIGALVPCSTAASRVLFAMGRDGTLPKWLGAICPKYRAPRNALHVVYAATVLGVVPITLLVGATPTINWWGNIFAWHIAVVYIFANLSNTVYYRRFLRSQFHILWNLVVPVIGVAAQVLVIWQLIIKEMWNRGPFGQSGQACILLAVLATATYVYAFQSRRSGRVAIQRADE